MGEEASAVRQAGGQPRQGQPLPGLLIVFEGLDASGISGQVARLTEAIKAHGGRAAKTKQPSDGPLGALLRLVLQRRLTYARAEDEDPAPAIEPTTVAMLYAADRLDHLVNEVEPRLARGIHMVCDRYVLSNLAYQGIDVEREWLRQINAQARHADITFFLSVPPEQSSQQIAERQRHGYSKELFEDQVKLEKVWRNFQELIVEEQAAGRQVEVVDGSQTADTIHQQIRDRVLAIITEREAQKQER